jgi:hypothetical protein
MGVHLFPRQSDHTRARATHFIIKTFAFTRMSTRPDLLTRGYALVPVIQGSQLRDTRHQFIHAMLHLPELQEGATTAVIGGFAAISTPSSQHHPLVRQLRVQLHDLVKPLFKQLRHDLRDPDLRMEQIVDRCMLRPQGVKASADSVHRDECKYALHGDHIFGGWLNLDTESQGFSCEPGSHLLGINSGGGFAAITDKAQIKAYKDVRKLVTVPPGNLLVFFENIRHDVVCKKTTISGGSARLFAGWRLTHAVHPLVPDTHKMLVEQHLMPLKSAQIPRMYPKLYWVNYVDKLAAWTATTLRPEYTVRKVVHAGKRKGESFTVPCEHIRTLKRKYEPYAQIELNMHTPQHF